jgi:hypothetical protein
MAQHSEPQNSDGMGGHYAPFVARFMEQDKRIDRLGDRTTAVETDMASLQAEHKGVMSDFYGNGQPGLRDTVRDFIQEIRTRDATVKTAFDDHNKTVSVKQNWLIAIVTIIGVIVAYAQLFKH